MPIIVFCEECGDRLRLTQEEIAESPGYTFCRRCKEIIKIAQPRELLNDLELRLGQRIVRMSPNRPVLTMGRKRHNDIVIRSSNISRTHATVVYLDSRYTLFDLSLNGTFIRFDGGNEVLLRRNSVTLNGSGEIGLGSHLPFDPEERIHFKVFNG